MGETWVFCMGIWNKHIMGVLPSLAVAQSNRKIMKNHLQIGIFHGDTSFMGYRYSNQL